MLVYAVDEGAADKHLIARDIMIRAMLLDAVLTAQALAEFLNVVRRKNLKAFAAARAQAERWAAIFPVAATSWERIANAAAFAERHRLQLWDSVIWQAARSMHASMILSEDMQDGLSIEGMTVLNPFATGNSDRLAELLTPPRETA
ncbi:MAG: PIN domain-containing protein [Sphingomicrobium sp.]